MMKQKENRAELEAKAHAYELELNQKMSEIKESVKVRAGQLLIAGAVVAAAYLTYSLLSSGDKKSKKEKDNHEESLLSSAVKSYALALALSFAKEKLMEYLHSLEETNDSTPEKN